MRYNIRVVCAQNDHRKDLRAVNAFLRLNISIENINTLRVVEKHRTDTVPLLHCII